MSNRRWIAVLLVIIGASSYGLLSSFIKMAYEQGFNEGQISASQMTVGAVMVWMVIACNPKAWKNPFKGPWVKLSAIGIFGLALTTIFYNIALSKLDASLSIILLFQFTWMTIALDCAVKRRIPHRAEMVAVVFIMMGTLLAVNVFQTDWSRFSLTGLLFGLLAGFTYSLFLFLTGQVKSELPPLLNSAIMLTAALPMIFLLYPPVVFVQQDGLQLIIWGILLGMLGQVIPTVAFNIGIPRIGSSVAAMLGSIELPAAVIAAFFLLGEAVVWIQWLGMGCILVGIVISEKKS